MTVGDVGGAAVTGADAVRLARCESPNLKPTECERHASSHVIRVQAIADSPNGAPTVGAADRAARLS